MSTRSFNGRDCLTREKRNDGSNGLVKEEVFGLGQEQEFAVEKRLADALVGGAAPTKRDDAIRAPESA